MARKSNLVPDTAASFNPKHQLQRKDILVESSKDCLLVNIKWSKTRQTGGQLLQLPVVSIPSSDLCPVSAFHNMSKLVPASPSSPAFLFSSKGKTSPLTYSQYQSTLKSLIQKINKNPKNYSSHSFRRGGATFAFQAGVSSELVKLMGDWRSEAYLEYLHIPLRSRTAAAIKMSNTFILHTTL
jgi:hypothetical protein